MMFKYYLTALIFGLLYVGIYSDPCLEIRDDHFTEQCLDSLDEEVIVKTILSEEKHIKSYLGALKRIGIDTIGLIAPYGFSIREINAYGYHFYIDPSNSHKTTLEIELSENCSSGNFKFGDTKYIVRGNLLKSNSLWSISAIYMIEIN